MEFPIFVSVSCVFSQLQLARRHQAKYCFQKMARALGGEPRRRGWFGGAEAIINEERLVLG